MITKKVNRNPPLYATKIYLKTQTHIYSSTIKAHLAVSKKEAESRTTIGGDQCEGRTEEEEDRVADTPTKFYPVQATSPPSR